METKHFANIQTIICETQPDSPQLCFCDKAIRSAVWSFKSGFPGTVAWAVKANPHPAVLQALISAGVSQFDVASKQEIQQVQRQLEDAVLHFNHPVKPRSEIEFAHGTAGVSNFAVDSAEEIDKIKSVLSATKADRNDVTLLVRFSDPSYKGTGNYDFGAKFGATPDEAAELLARCDRDGFRVGLTFHVGSQSRSPSAYERMMCKAREIALVGLNGNLERLARLNVGGGFPCHYPEGLEPHRKTYFDVIRDASPLFDCELICEPGRALVSDSIHVLSRINLRRAGRNCLYINDGFYGSFMELPFVDFAPPVRAYRSDGTPIDMTKDVEMFDVWGPTCDSLDRLPKPVMLPASVGTGDYLEFGLMGAYTNATQTGFNGAAPAKLVHVHHLESWPVAQRTTEGPRLHQRRNDRRQLA